ncbi:hypothetical protein FIBSPDRAFT_398548 [Athelia psychrophila]|uniref:C2H2-type domain-containing protein n=1 Tax=Athelia psychrophila TaxID=1759441 RepID=A0A167V091_9AGAM|nr:hypothetical protein FIBSPDRAFT_398548 [Fibularhizoctonia sp. CBS 109695]
MYTPGSNDHDPCKPFRCPASDCKSEFTTIKNTVNHMLKYCPLKATWGDIYKATSLNYSRATALTKRKIQPTGDNAMPSPKRHASEPLDFNQPLTTLPHLLSSDQPYTNIPVPSAEPLDFNQPLITLPHLLSSDHRLNSEFIETRVQPDYGLNFNLGWDQSSMLAVDNSQSHAHVQPDYGLNLNLEWDQSSVLAVDNSQLQVPPDSTYGGIDLIMGVQALWEM